MVKMVVRAGVVLTGMLVVSVAGLKMFSSDGTPVGRPVEINPARDCGDCLGMGRQTGSCAVCDGDGQRTSGLTSPVACVSCGGSGSVAMVCPTCGGTGRERLEREEDWWP